MSSNPYLLDIKIYNRRERYIHETSLSKTFLFSGYDNFFQQLPLPDPLLGWENIYLATSMFSVPWSPLTLDGSPKSWTAF